VIVTAIVTYTLHSREKGIHTDRRYTATDTSCARDGSIERYIDSIRFLRYLVQL